ncbi:MAG: ParM/StbA family protein [Pseudomonadota bacterium]
MEIVGLDLGCGYTKAVSGTRSDVFKSVIGTASERPLSDDLALTDASDRHREFALADSGKRYYLGDLAERECDSPKATLEAGEFFDEFAPSLAPASLAWLLGRDVEELGVVVGLPMAQFADHRERLTDMLTGQHQVDLYERGGGSKRVKVTVSEVCVLPQPLGSALHLMLGDDGQVVEQEIFDKKIGVIDVGLHATGFAVAHRGDYSRRASATAPNGLARAYRVIADRLQEASGVAVDLHRLSAVLQAGSIRIHGTRYDLRRIAEQAYEDLAIVIAKYAEKHWRDEWDLDVMLLTGGGGPLLAPWLAPALRGEVVLADEGTDPRLANAWGFAKYGRRLWSLSPSA